MPDGYGVENDCVSLSDLGGILDGRYSRTKQTVRHPGIRVLVRSSVYNVGWKKAKEIVADLGSMQSTNITLDGDTYTVYNVSVRSTIKPLGLEGGVKRRNLFAVDLVATFEEVGVP
jgi:hypothetical protein